MLQKFVWRQCYLQKVNRPQSPFTLKDSEIYIKKINQASHAKFHFHFFFSFLFLCFPLGHYLSIYIHIYTSFPQLFLLNFLFLLLLVFCNNGSNHLTFVPKPSFCSQIIQRMISYKEFLNRACKNYIKFIIR